MGQVFVSSKVEVGNSHVRKPFSNKCGSVYMCDSFLAMCMMLVYCMYCSEDLTSTSPWNLLFYGVRVCTYVCSGDGVEFPTNPQTPPSMVGTSVESPGGEPVAGALQEFLSFVRLWGRGWHVGLSFFLNC